MRTFLAEYGKTAITIIACLLFYIILDSFFFGNDMEVVYKTWSPDIDSVYSSGNSEVVSDIVAHSSVPYFEVTSDSITFTKEEDFTKSNLLNYVKAYAGGSQLSGSEISMLVYRYVPVIKMRPGDRNGSVVLTTDWLNDPSIGGGSVSTLESYLENSSIKYTEFFATDKYGHYLYDSSGNKIVTKQPVYKIETLTTNWDGSAFVFDEVSSKYKVVCRVVHETLKAECELFVLVNETPVRQDNIEIDFQYVETPNTLSLRPELTDVDAELNLPDDIYYNDEENEDEDEDVVDEDLDDDVDVDEPDVDESTDTDDETPPEDTPPSDNPPSDDPPSDDPPSDDPPSDNPPSDNNDTSDGDGSVESTNTTDSSNDDTSNSTGLSD